ncbi:MAG: T9SS type A sorting domain-containing protein [Bacteroidota bacterium]
MMRKAIKLLVLIISSCLTINGQSANYYISSSEGDDTNDGISEITPWKTLEKISSTVLLPGDSVFFLSGDTLVGQFIVNGSGTAEQAIVVGCYGEGDLPVIDGAKAEGGAYSSAILINNNDHIELRDLEVTNDRLISREGEDDAKAVGIYVHNDGITTMYDFYFHDLIIRDVYAIIPKSEDTDTHDGVGIYFRSESNTEAGKEKNISEVLVEDCYITHTSTKGIWGTHGGGTGVGNDSINRNMNLIFRNNYFFETGGAGIVPGRSYNCLVEYNTFEYHGSSIDPRMSGSGSGSWFWKGRNIIVQYNKSLHGNGENDAYGHHVDWSCKNVVMQYNYSEDIEGGFAEVLGNNEYAVWRFNVSVNDCRREFNGNSIWVSAFAGKNNPRTPSKNTYIYNNTIYVSGDISPDIDIEAKTTFVYNNAFYTSGNATIGNITDIITFEGGELKMSHNLFYGGISYNFVSLDEAPVYEDPRFIDPGALNTDGYKLNLGSAALNAGLSFEEPVFPQAGYGIFKDITPVPVKDMYGNPVSIGTTAPHIGAYNGEALDVLSVKDLTGVQNEERDMVVYTDPHSNTFNIAIEAYTNETIDIRMIDIAGRTVFTTSENITQGMNKLKYPIENNMVNGTYIISVYNNKSVVSRKLKILM